MISEYTWLIFHEIGHGLIAAPLALFVWHKSHSLKNVLILMVVTYFMDLDHLVDFWLTKGINLNINEFLSVNYFEEAGRAIVLLHGWEYVAILGFLGHKRGFKSYYTSISLGMFMHLVLDSFNLKSILFYSFVYRLLINFATI